LKSPRKPAGLDVLVLCRRIYKFDAQSQVADLIQRIEGDADLHKELEQCGYYYRLDMATDAEFYCIILHSAKLLSTAQETLGKYARHSGGTRVTDQKLLDAFSAYALARHTVLRNRNPLQKISWDARIKEPGGVH
jgi:hypothetical protein